MWTTEGAYPSPTIFPEGWIHHPLMHASLNRRIASSFLILKRPEINEFFCFHFKTELRAATQEYRDRTMNCKFNNCLFYFMQNSTFGVFLLFGGKKRGLINSISIAFSLHGCNKGAYRRKKESGREG